MSEVICFRPGNPPRRSARAGGGAQILFFTGVRYQRLNEDERVSAPPAPSVVQRQREKGGADGARRR